MDGSVADVGRPAEMSGATASTDAATAAPGARTAGVSWSLLSVLRRMEASVWFLVLALPVGLYLAVSIPPSQGLDEPAHFYRVYQISQGHLVSERSGPWAGGVLPDCVMAYMNDNFTTAYTWGSQFSWPAFAAPPTGCDPASTRWQTFVNTAVYSPVSYLPQVAGVGAARVAGASLPWVFLAGRLAGLLGYLGLVFLALRLAPIGRNVMLVVALLPMALISASVYSGDGMTLAYSLVLVAGVLRCWRDPRATWRTFALAAVAALALALSKSTYFVLAPLLLLVPARVFPSRRVALAAQLGTLAVIGLAAAAWYAEVSWVQLSRTDGHLDPHGQIQYILHHPTRYARFVVLTLFGPLTSGYTWTGFVGWVGWQRNATAGQPAPPILLVVYAFIVLWMAYRSELFRPLALSAGTVLRAAWPVALVAANMVLIVTALYIADSPPAAGVYWNVHGRYFLPFAAVPVLSLAMITSRLGRSTGSALPFAAGMSVLVAYLLGKVAIYFY
ncbi:MAG TPA: DUF2142 domain-containing protein [Candidatus Dormibacteraeota bacterium]